MNIFVSLFRKQHIPPINALTNSEEMPKKVLTVFLLVMSALQIPNVVFGVLNRGIWAPFTIASTVAICLTLALYFLSKTPYYRWAAIAVIGLFMVFPASIVGDANANIIFCFWLLVPIVLAAIFFRPIQTFLVLGLVLCELVLLSAGTNTFPVEELPLIASIFTVVGAIVVCYSMLRKRDVTQILAQAKELEQRQRNLRAANLTLEAQISDRTVELTEANDALMRRDQYLSDILAALPDAIIEVTEDFTEIDFHENENVPLYAIVDALYRIGNGEWLDLDTIMPLYNAIDLAFSSRIAQHVEFDIDKETFSASCVLAHRSKVLIVIRNISRQQKIESYLQTAQQQESISVLAGGIGHDLNNLLLAIITQSALASRKLDANSKARKHVDRVQSSGQSAKILTRQLMAYSRNEKLERRQLNLNTLVNANLEMFHTTIGKEAELIVDLAPAMPDITANEAQLQQIVMNLLINSMQALDGHGEIRIKTGVKRASGTTDHLVPIIDGTLSPGNYCYLVVEDTGVGMDQETAERIFEPFFTTKLTGTGLGLSATLRILREHGGNIGLKTALGEGTTFYLYLPAILNETGELATVAR